MTALIERRGEQHRLAPRRGGLQDPSDGGEEPHVRHAVCFVDHQHFDIVEAERALCEKVLEAPGAGDDDVCTLVQRLQLGPVADPAEDSGDDAAVERGQRVQRVGDLAGQLPGGREDEPGRTATVGVARVCDERKTERQGLARAGRGATGDVATGEGVGEHGGLDGKRRLDIGAVELGEELGRRAEVGESGRWLGNLVSFGGPERFGQLELSGANDRNRDREIENREQP